MPGPIPGRSVLCDLYKMLRILKLTALIGLFSSCTSFKEKRVVSSIDSKTYSGCLIFSDDVRTTEDIDYALSYQADLIIRSWYRWGEPGPNKKYSDRAEVIQYAAEKNVLVGGGTSLSVVSEEDFKDPSFQREWLSVDLNGNAIKKNELFYGTLSAPEFRSYLIKKLIEQADLGIRELHLGESNGAIYFDDWSLGLKGSFGFVQWIKEKHADKNLEWWEAYLGALGKKIFKGEAVARADFINLNATEEGNFKAEWGKTKSWNGTNENGEPAYLAELYKRNLESFLIELKASLQRVNKSDVVVDVWGFASWMPKMSVQPDAYMSTPPDERWGLHWSTDVNFSIPANRTRIREEILKQIESVKPVPVVYMIDHPKPFNDFKNLPDARQAELLQFFSDLFQELNANFAFRSYSTERRDLGNQVINVTKAACAAK